VPIRSITLKLVIPRKTEKGIQAARDLFTTHCAVNKAVEYYEQHLLKMRGQGYHIEDDTFVSEETTGSQLESLIKAACQSNGRNSPLPGDEIEEIKTLLRKLYEYIVPSSIGAKGDAQQANAFISPLTDPHSRAFIDIFDKVSAPPSWLAGIREGDQSAYIEACGWLKSPEGKDRLCATGSPPNWVRKVRKGDTDWPVSFLKDYEKKLEDIQGVPVIIKSLRDKKVLPLFDPYLAPKITGSRAALTPWDRLAFRLAVAHLLSWESWCRKTKEEHERRKLDVDRFRQRYLSRPELQRSIEILRCYEYERHKELATLGLAPVKPFLITRRMIRNWPDLRERLRKSKDKSQEALLKILSDQQTKLMGKFGDPHLYSFLIRPENHHVWEKDADVVSLVTHYNTLQRIFERTRSEAIMTLPDSLEHPRSVQWEPAGGSNLKNYRLTVEDNTIYASLPVLQAQGEVFAESTLKIKLAPSEQFKSMVIDTNGKQTHLTFSSQTGELFTGILNSADLLFDCDFFRHHNMEAVISGTIGPAYLKVVIDITPKYPAGWDRKRPHSLMHFTTARGNEKYAANVTPGLRVLSVDMGLGTFAACSVFELRDSEPNKKLAFPVCHGLWAVHERSFLLTMPGEVPDKRSEEWRRGRSDELRKLRSMLSHYKQYYPLKAAADPDQRLSIIDSLLGGVEDRPELAFSREILSSLKAHAGLSAPEWEQRVAGAIKHFRENFGIFVKNWRSANKPRTPGKMMGKSMWAIDYLTRVRSFLVSWSLSGMESNEIRRLDRARMGVYAGGLLRHLDGIKNDRLKTGADLIIQAARGAFGKGNPSFSPCHAVLFEDLSRYRMKTDRPRRENSQLMRWAHRSIPSEVKMQGEIYGIHTCETEPAFSSRYHAATQVPGIRCHTLTKEDMGNIELRKIIETENPEIQWGRLRPGSIVPISGGDLFVCLNASHGLITIHADINAAQNLQRRFWTRHAEAYRIPCRRLLINGEERWVPKSMGKRIMGSLKGYGWLVPTDHQSGSCRWENITRKEWLKLGGSVKETDGESTDDLNLEDVEEWLLEDSGEVVVFFRDPSSVLFPKDLWYPSKAFWGSVKRRTVSKLLECLTFQID